MKSCKTDHVSPIVIRYCVTTASVFLHKALFSEFPVPPINDGFWHHVGVTWSTHVVRSLDQYSIYLDGILIYNGEALGLNMPLKAYGVFAIGQKLLSTNGTFNLTNSFSGKLSQVNVWNYDAISHDVVRTTLSQSCLNDVGNIINWSALRDRASKAVVKEQRSSCMPLRNSRCCFRS